MTEIENPTPINLMGITEYLDKTTQFGLLQIFTITIWYMINENTQHDITLL